MVMQLGGGVVGPDRLVEGARGTPLWWSTLRTATFS